MSYDIKLQNPCDHRINWMREDLESDRRTVMLTYPVAAQSSFSIRVNNTVADQEDYSVVIKRKDPSLVIYSYVYFDAKIKHNDPIIEANYTTLLEQCPKCRSVKTIDDFRYNPSGDIITTNKERLLLQNVEKVIVTKLASNPFHEWYGTGLHSLIGSKITSSDYLKTKIVENVTSAIDNFRGAQKQLVASGRKTDPGELFGELQGVTVQATDEPTMIQVIVSFTAQSGNTIEYSQMLELPQIRERLAF